MHTLRLRPPGPDDEAVVAAAQRSMEPEDFTFTIGWDVGRPWRSYLALLDGLRRGIEVPDGFVPSTLLLAEVGGRVVGRASIRFALNDFLAREGGHIGYCVLPDHRRCGFATEILRQSLVVARASGVEAALLTCDDDNVASQVVIERCGGVLADVVTSTEDGRPVRRYWIA